MAKKEVFKCLCCGVCCQGDGGIFLPLDGADGPAKLLNISTEEFIEKYTEPRHGMLCLKIGDDGFCMFHDRERHTCLIHEAKPRMCRDWPFFYGMLANREGFEDAKEACPGISPDATWEEFLDYHKETIGTTPPVSYIFKVKKKN